jgi:hypothetical protein
MEAMEQLHAPWRIEYILAPKRPLGGTARCRCFRQIAEAADDVANLVVLRARTVFRAAEPASLQRRASDGGAVPAGGGAGRI